MPSLFQHLQSILLSSTRLFSGLTQKDRQPQVPSWPSLKAQIRAEFPTVKHIGITDLEQHLLPTQQEKTLIVDVRAPEEFAVSHLKGAVNLEDPEAILQLAQQQQAEQIVLYCSVGYRSAQMAQMIEEQGWDAVVNFEGSIFEWANSGRPVFLKSEEVEVVHPFDPVWGKLLDGQYHPTE
ncbi:rhodanese-like domain-containing protein [Roseofilum casamattae]|uniref:Rhodanese-like domain-containing protein n=1 Tax=Roseofilum casamattae BLCC-M143 TaxID=3022442 RepID=A0ABT7BTG0_9CYAN|nr:rhodanese-like domain-containing protein [Roseofilum casamattae]MDJ1182473.1 rhodanese-like domain-containing protein [Roseofilum casamattae BLCC-M143]